MPTKRFMAFYSRNQTYVVEIEAESPEEAKEIWKEMKDDGELYKEGQRVDTDADEYFLDEIVNN